MKKNSVAWFWGIGFGVLGSLFESVWICSGRYKSQTCLVFFTTVTDPLSPLPTNSQVSAFLRHPQTQIYTILCCLSRPATPKLRALSLKMSELSPKPQQKSPIAVLRNLLLVTGGLKKPQTSLRPSRYIPYRIRIETDHKLSLIVS